MFGHKRVVFKKNKIFGWKKDLFADLYFPRNFEKKKVSDRITIIFLPGLGSDRTTILKKISRRVLKDYLLFIPELRMISEPDGEEKLLKAASDEIEFYIKKARQYGENIFVCGHSLGGYLVLYTFSRKRIEKYLKGACLISTPYSLKDVMFRLSINLIEFLGEKLDKVGPIIRKIQRQVPGLKYSKRKRGVYFYKFKFSKLSDVKGLYDAPSMLDFRTPPMPLLIIHGIEDRLVSFSHAVRLFQKFKERREDTQLMLLPYADHGIGKRKKEASTKIKEWIEEIMDIEREKEAKKRLRKEEKQRSN